jgi:hypothetical protein
MMQNQLFLLVVMVFTIIGCKIDRKSVIDRDKFTYSYTDDSFLFFRNVRQIYYDFQDLPKAHWYAFRWSDRYQQSDVPAITPVIVIDWYKKETYILMETNEPLQLESQLLIKETNSSTGKSYTYSLKERGRENMLEFATKIYEGLMAENTLMINVNGKYEPLFVEKSAAESFRVVMADYYRLTNVFTTD